MFGILIINDSYKQFLMHLLSDLCLGFTTVHAFDKYPDNCLKGFIGNMVNQSPKIQHNLTTNFISLLGSKVNSIMGQRISRLRKGIDLTILWANAGGEFRQRKLSNWMALIRPNFRKIKGLIDRDFKILHKKLYISTETEKMTPYILNSNSSKLYDIENIYYRII